MAALNNILLKEWNLTKNLKLQNKLVMAPMTRSRANVDGVLSNITTEYYGQRAHSAGLIITEGTQPSSEGQGYARTPGLYNEEHVTAWKRVVDEVHKNGSKIFVQLMHAGRVSSYLNRNTSAVTVSASAVKANSKMYTDASGLVDTDLPKELTEDEIKRVISDFAHSTKLALKAGFDGVELHSANGYLPHQFLSSNANIRKDKYGNSDSDGEAYAIGHTQFVVETLEAIIAAAGGDSGKVAMKISPTVQYNDIVENDSKTLYRTLLKRIAPLNLAFLEVTDYTPNKEYLDLVREEFKGAVVAGGGFNPETAVSTVQNNKADAIAFGKLFLANPDLKKRLELNASNGSKSFNEVDQSTFYTPGEKGYTDYPLLSTSA